jgi:hypothetical protein
VNGLTGAQAVARLERRGGEVSVFRRGYGSQVVFTCVGRDQGHAIVAITDVTESRRVVRDRRLVIRSDTDRAALEHEMETARDEANAHLERVEYSYILVHRDILDTDAGYGQIGCVLILASVAVGLVAGLVGGWLATGSVAVSSALIGPIAGLAVGFYGLQPVASIAVNSPALRDRIVNLAYGFSLVVPAIVTAVTIVAMTVLSDAS